MLETACLEDSVSELTLGQALLKRVSELSGERMTGGGVEEGGRSRESLPLRLHQLHTQKHNLRQTTQSQRYDVWLSGYVLALAPKSQTTCPGRTMQRPTEFVQQGVVVNGYIEGSGGLGGGLGGSTWGRPTGPTGRWGRPMSPPEGASLRGGGRPPPRNPGSQKSSQGGTRIICPKFEILGVPPAPRNESAPPEIFSQRRPCPRGRWGGVRSGDEITATGQLNAGKRRRAQ